MIYQAEQRADNRQEDNIVKKLAVLFPGIGYTTDRPLLYYAGKLAEQNGFEVIKISYGNLPEADMSKMFEYARMAANVEINRIAFEEYDRVLFISKSIGTAVAGAMQQNIPMEIGNIFLTPIKQSLSYLHRWRLVFSGNEDSWISMPELARFHKQEQFDLHIVKGANHSLETGDAIYDLQAMRGIMKLCEAYLRDGMEQGE